MKPIKEYLLLTVVGLALWLFVIGVMPLPHYVSDFVLDGGVARTTVATDIWEPVLIWLSRDRREIMFSSCIACVIGFPAAAMAIRRLRRKGNAVR